jgi:hypothetical protein
MAIGLRPGYDACMRPTWAAVLCFVLSACSSSTAPSVPLNQDFILAPRQIAAIEGTTIRVRFVAVEGDSRCPADVFCIQGGDALVKIEVQSARGTQPYDLHTGSLTPVVHDRLTITLVQLVPYPFSTRTTQPEDYRVTLRVTQ